MTINWKSLSLILTGVLVGCAGNAAQTAFADNGAGGGSYKCIGPSMSAGGVEDDLTDLAARGYVPVFATEKIVCGRR